MWEQIFPDDSKAIDEFMTGLKLIRVQHADYTPDEVLSLFKRKKLTEAWIYRDKLFTLGMLMFYKPETDAYRFAYAYIVGPTDIATATKLFTSNMNDYVLRLGGKDWYVVISKDYINDMAIINPQSILDNTVTKDNTTTITKDTAQDTAVVYDVLAAPIAPVVDPFPVKP